MRYLILVLISFGNQPIVWKIPKIWLNSVSNDIFYSSRRVTEATAIPCDINFNFIGLF